LLNHLPKDPGSLAGANLIVSVSEQALEQAKAFARAERDGLISSMRQPQGQPAVAIVSDRDISINELFIMKGRFLERYN